MRIPRSGVLGVAGVAAAFTVVFSKPLLVAVGSSDRFVGAVLDVTYGAAPKEPAATGDPVRMRVDGSRILAEVDPRFLSFAVDTSQVVGGHFWAAAADRVEIARGSERVPPFDFTRPALARLAAELAPAYLRIGGTEADHVYYSPNDHAPAALPPGYELAFTRRHWDAVNAFVRRTGLDLFFTVNAGPGPRDERGAWTPHNFEALARHARARGDAVAVWELGNEVNGYPFVHGPSHRVTGERYAEDVRVFAEVVERYTPDARVVGPAGFLWPVMGEPLSAFFGIYEDFLKAGGGDALDALTWHFYPQQSRRCPMATRRAGPEVLLNPVFLDEQDRWAAYVSRLRDRHAPQIPLWLGETGNAQCGGEPGVSDRFASTLWWLDALGAAARSGQPVVVRQTLAGSHYGMLDDATLEPRPDYYASVLHKRLMGTRVLAVSRAEEKNPYVRLYAHCTAERSRTAPGSVTVLVVNLDREHEAVVRHDGALGPRAQVYRLGAPRLDSTTVELNGAPLRTHSGELPLLEPIEIDVTNGALALPPLSASFVVFPAANAAACR
ncbi:MAG: hypothetical protein DIU78_018135 [Pseudomonadota bacterium]